MSDAHKVLEMQRQFYQELYTTDDRVKFELDEVNVPCVQDTTARTENSFSKLEIAEAVAKLKNGSCPGCDGIPAEFYKVFWRQVGDYLHNAITYTYESEDKILHQSARQGILNLIPKGDKDTRLLKNLRPITLLNTDYKVIEKAIANRMLPGL